MKDRILKLVTQYGAKYGRFVGYPLFYLFCLLVFSSWTFPYDKLKERVVSTFNVEQKASGGMQELQIDEIGGYWLSGVRMTGVTLLSAPSEPGKPPGRLVIDEATLRYAILPLIFGSHDLGFDLHLFDGEASGTFEQQGKDTNVDLTLRSIDLGRIQPLVAILGVPLEGKLGGTIRLSLLDGKGSKGTGQVALESKGTAVGDGKAKLKGALALPRLDVGSVTFAADAKDGVMKFTKFVAGGKDLDVQGDGRITMRDLATDSLCDAQVRFRINDMYRSKNDLTKSLFGAPGSTAPALFELADPKVKSSKRSDGFYAWAIRGPLSHLDFVPSPQPR